MLTFNYRFLPIRAICLLLLLIGLNLGIASCSDRVEVAPISSAEQPSPPISAGKLSEVAPPLVIEQLDRSLEQYQPQVDIISPQSDRVLQETTVAVELQVQDLPIFKDSELGMGPHLELIVDNEPTQEVYDIDKPIVLENLTPGTHTLRVFASRPWHESFKNEGAYAQTTFHVLTKTDSNKPIPSLPLLTYSSPQGSYGAEPILLDFYLTNAPLHAVAKASPDLEDWRIRVTINGQSFVLDNWQPVYLTGFEKGNNWVQLEFLNENGDRVDNAFNTTVRLIEYNPKGQDSLSKLMRGELAVEYARSIVEPGYKAKLTPAPTPTPTGEPEVPAPTPEETPTAETEIPATTPAETPTTETEVPAPTPAIEVPAESPAPELKVISEPTQTVSPQPETPMTESVQPTETIEETKTAAPSSEVEESVSAVASPVAPQESPPLVETPSPSKAPAFSKPQWLDRVLDRFQQSKST